MADLRRNVRLPYGFTAEFVFRPSPHFFEVYWAPDRPRIRNRRAQRKFFAAYTSQRDHFLRAAATMIGGAVLIADVGGNLGGITVYQEVVVHRSGPRSPSGWWRGRSPTRPAKPRTGPPI